MFLLFSVLFFVTVFVPCTCAFMYREPLLYVLLVSRLFALRPHADIHDFFIYALSFSFNDLCLAALHHASPHLFHYFLWENHS
jgi:hypothetical protein